MRAAIYRETGGSDVLSVEDVLTPVPGAGEVRVRITCSGINPTDWKTRSGLTGGSPLEPQVPHHDGAGVIEAVGPGVDERRVGQRVWLYMALVDTGSHGFDHAGAVVVRHLRLERRSSGQA